jgi:transposase InsO family protein
MTPDFCVEALQEALGKYGKPEIFNTDQGSQFTSGEWIDTLKAAGVQISMDGKGRWIDNVFIERLWRFCAHGRYVVDCARRGTRAGPAAEKKPHNDGRIVDKGRGPAGSKDDFGKVGPDRLRIVESVERAGRKAIWNSASRAMTYYRAMWLDQYVDHLQLASRTSGLPQPSCEL